MKPNQDKDSDLRQKAEAILENGKSDSETSEEMEIGDIRSLVQELRIHQIELEMQNEELMRAKLEIENALAKYSDLYDFAPIGLFALDEKRQILDVNIAGAELLGVTRHNLLNRRFELFIAQEDRLAFGAFCKSAFKTSTRQTCELRLLRDEVPTIYARIEGMATGGSKPNERQYRIAVINISECKQAEEALRDSEEKFRLFMDNSPAIAWMKDEQGRYVYLSKAYEDRLGVRQEDWHGKTDFEIWPPQIAEQFRKNDQAVLAAGRPIEVMEEALNPDGVRSYWWNFKFPLQDSSGKRYIAGIGVDITERKRTEEELRITKDKLEVKVRERTAELVKVNQELQANIEEIKRADGLLKLQHDLAVALSSIIDLKDALGLILDTALKIKGIDCGGIYSVNSDGGVDLMLHRGLSDEFIQRYSHCDANSPRARMVATGEQVYKDFAAICEQSLKDIQKEGLRSLAILPVKYKGKVIADLNLASRTYDEIPLDVRATLEAIAASIGGVIAKLKAEDELKAAHDRLFAIIEFLPDATLVIDRDKKVVAWNKALEEMTGVSKTDVIGKGNYAYSIPFYGEPRPMLIDLIDRYDGAIESKYDHIERKGRTINAEAYVPSLFMGRGAYVWATASLLYDSKGELVGSIESIRDITKRKLAEEQLRDSENRYKAILENTGAATFISEEDTIVSFANEKCEELTGYTKEEIEGKKSWTEFIFEDDLDRMLIQHHLRRKNPDIALKTYELRMRDKNGQIKDILLTADLIPGTKKSVASLLDISERKKAENAVLESKEYLNKIINSIGDPVFVKDRQHRLVLVNDAACRLFDRSREDVLGRTAYDLFQTKEMADISWQKDEEVFRTREESVNEETNTYAPGVTRTVLVKKTLFMDNNGDQFLVGITKDITERKQAQEQIRFQAALLDQVHNAVIATDLNGNIIYWNRFAKALLQWTTEEILGRNIAETVVPEGQLDIMRSVISRLIANGSCEGEFSLKKKDGCIVPTYHSFSTIKNDLGDIIGLVGVAIDITELKRAEEALKEAKDAAEASTKAKSEFLANMSHEIRTPMNAVIGLIELLQRTDLDQEQRDYVNTIRSSGDSLLSVINNILDFSKIDSGKIELGAQPFDLKDCIEGSLDLVATEASKKGLNLAYVIDTNTPEAIIDDPARLRQILINLLSNAIKFTNKGEVVVRVSGRKLKGNNYEVHFAVKDTGIGIPEDKIGHLFQPFSQVDASTTRKYGGTGLGLAISKRLVEMMGGRIWAQSEVGKGSTFQFTILAEATTIKPISSKAIAEQHKIDPSQSQPSALRILLAEDNPVNQKVALQMLRKIGYEADVAANGLEVLKALEHQTYDIILMDVQMPEMDGLEAAKKIRERWHNGPKIIAITAYALEGDRDRCLDVGMDDYISKPIQLDELRSKLIKWGTDIERPNAYS